MSGKNAVVIDNGTGFTKMGYSGNLDPDFVFPTAIADLAKKSNLSVSTKNDEYNYYIGDEVLSIQSESNNHVPHAERYRRQLGHDGKVLASEHI